jgi:hypothetical protein
MRNGLLKSFALFALLTTVFAGCKKDEPTYMVQVTATEGGTVEGQNGEYKEGETVVFTAIPADDYYFVKWSDGDTNNPRTITITDVEITLTAQFAQSPLVTISASDNGTIETDVNGRYAPGSTVTVTAKPADGCGFMGWSDGNTDNPRTITIGNEDISLTALFAVMFFAPTVDLGLERGTLWATCNVGAANPWDYGNYYAWGETETKDDYSWETYKYCKGTEKTLTKYCYDAEYGSGGFTDALKTLELADDVATAVIGSDYSMPTKADWEELGSQCYWVWTVNYNNQNVNGYIVYKAKTEGDKGVKVYSGSTPSATYSLKDAHIFLPAAGCRDYTDLNDAGSSGDYWSASLHENYPDCAPTCGFNSGSVSPSRIDGRCYGFSVRPVRRK